VCAPARLPCPVSTPQRIRAGAVARFDHMPGNFLDRNHTIAPPGFSRWRVPPAALAIHLCIGQVYAFSVFNLPLSRLIGGTESAPTDWKLSTIGWVFSTAIVFLGLSAAVFGRWVERVG